MRMVSSEELGRVVSALPGAPRVVCPGTMATPLPLLHVIDGALETWRLFCVNAPKGVPVREGVLHETVFVGPGVRKVPRLRYIPSRLSLAPHLFTTTCPPDVVVLHTSTPRDGVVSMGIEVQVMLGALEAARRRGALVVAQVNPRMPFVHGDGVVPTDMVDLGVEVEVDLPETPHIPVDEASQTIGDLVAPMVPDGASLQAGIGAVPEAVVSRLTSRRGLRVWTELMTSKTLVLDRAGALDPQAPVVGTFLTGDREFYDWIDDNPRVRLLRCETTNSPASIAAQPQMRSINAALQVDLFAAANATRIGTRIYSGVGGSTDFQIGAMHSPGGRSIIAMRSWHPRADVSTIVGKLDSPTSIMQMSSVVTECGVADLFGASQSEQARLLIEHAAHPRAREGLWEEARSLGLA